MVDGGDQRARARALYYSQGRVVIAHRFGFGLVYGAAVLDSVRVLGHRCDNPLCQRVHPDHVVASSFEANRREFLIRRDLIGSPLGDPRGARRRARELRDLARVDPGLVAVDLARLRDRYGEQMPVVVTSCAGLVGIEAAGQQHGGAAVDLGSDGGDLGGDGQVLD